MIAMVFLSTKSFAKVDPSCKINENDNIVCAYIGQYGIAAQTQGACNDINNNISSTRARIIKANLRKARDEYFKTNNLNPGRTMYKCTYTKKKYAAAIYTVPK